jgi:hypothetical protein
MVLVAPRLCGAGWRMKGAAVRNPDRVGAAAASRCRGAVVAWLVRRTTGGQGAGRSSAADDRWLGCWKVECGGEGAEHRLRLRAPVGPGVLAVGAEDEVGLDGGVAA